MVKRFVAELPRKQILCAGSELSTASFGKCYQSCAKCCHRRCFLEHHSRETSNKCRPVPGLGHQLNPRVRNTCPVVQILHCFDPISMC
jgi:hypothetical protein